MCHYKPRCAQTPHFSFLEHAYCADEVSWAEVEALEGLFANLSEFLHGHIWDLKGGGGGVVLVEVGYF